MEEIIHAFTTLLRASNSKRVSRRAGKGTWGGQTGPKKIQNSKTGCIIGQSKMLAYEHSGEADVGHWTMHEYCLSKEYVKESGISNAADLVVCKITKTIKKKPQPLADANQANEVLFANPGGVPTVQQSDEPLQLDAYKPYYGGYELPVVQSEMSYPRISDGSTVLPYSGGYEAPAPVPIPVPASPFVSMKRAAEVDLPNEDDLKVMI
ncbi:hypothetical protein SASPL_131361 [Salvia splendens]|uniref:NAC domain-containing protein n=1 Tax=Salvia splendens TaxID=180675 RepID=A0A8X8ZKT1_SALSN|nr:hypothetical protein SASPL_131361 [Salvia splendens]